MSELQAIAFYKSPYGSWTKSKAMSWLKKHDYYPIKEVHETKNMLHYRLTDPSKRYKSFASRTAGKGEKKVLLTIGILKNTSKRLAGGALETQHEYQEVYPLSKESGILSKPILPPAEANRSLNPDMVTVQDIRSDKVAQVRAYESPIPSFDANTLLGALMLPRSQGGLGFPYPTSAGTYTPSAVK